MKLIAINGSPRKKWNTYNLLAETMKGAESKGAEVELFNLYDLVYKGCLSCFACKRKNIILDYCTIKDDLQPVLEKIKSCDALVIGSPIYFGCVSGETRSFVERLFFPYISYDAKPSSFGRKIKTAFIFTMNVSEQHLETVGYKKMFNDYKKIGENLFGSSEILYASETLQFDDYSKYASGMFDVKERTIRHETVFKEDLKKAFELGAGLVS